MEDGSEVYKLLKYILFTTLVSHITLAQSRALVTESPPIAPVPFYHSEEVRSDLIASFNGNREGFRKRRQDDLDPERLSEPMERTSGGHKETRQAPSGPPRPHSRLMPAQSPHSHISNHNHNQHQNHPHGRFAGSSSHHSQDPFGSLCSIFRTFLEPRRFHRCNVYNGEPSGPPSYYERDGPGSTGPSHGPLHTNDLNHEPPTGIPPHLQQQQQQHRQQQHMQMQMQQQHEIQREGHHGPNNNNNNNNNIGNNNGPPRHDLGVGGPPPPIIMPSQSIAEKRYDHIEDIHINHSGEEDEDDQHLIHHPGIPQQHQIQIDPTKISQDRTMIVVPERTCPQGQRRDPRGYCRRLVKIRTNYQYGPPPGVVRPIPIRYYYSRIVAIPTLHFFFQNLN